MTANELFDKILAQAEKFGLVAKNEGSKIINSKGNAIIRNNLVPESFDDGKAYFGFISEDEETTGLYSDFSFVIFPDDKNNVQTCIVCLGIGSTGFKNDYQLASHPGLRRTFLKLNADDGMTFFKTSFDDIESVSSDLKNEIRANYPKLQTVVEKFQTVLPASRIVDINQSDSFDIIYTWLATYAKIRSWGTAAQKKYIHKYLVENIPSQVQPNEEEEIQNLLNKRKYVVLQGAPGTGKTFTALKISNSKSYNKTFFEQFHAETTYSDFVYGIEPNMKEDDDKGRQFVPKKGVLYQAIKYAQENPKERVLLVIDEINRANLSNVLGPVFYLFEYQTAKRTVKIKIGDLDIDKLPDNIDVIATMNTADRSLAVVDFALRRRFAWYTLRPHEVSPGDGLKFMKETYNKIADIFFEYASDDELHLQPGQSYFIVPSKNKDAEMKDRLIYELMPLIKEYLAEGYLLKAKDSFCDLFLKETGRLMYE
jgi:5-methylcytosine-specific restriction protein B